jgi:WD40-like Beta Propeller Repeat
MYRPVLVAVLLVGCAASDPNPGRANGAAAVSGATPSAAGGRGVNANGSGVNVSDNPTATPVPTPASGGAGQNASGGMSMVPGAANAPNFIDQTGAGNPAGLMPDEVQQLMAGGPPGNMRWLYPYDGTVFPRGLLAPLLMWDGAQPDAVYVHLKSQTFEYKGCLKPTAGQAGPQVALPQDVWTAAGKQTHGQSDPYTLELSARAGGAVTGPVVLHFGIAQATVKGSIYYNTYNSKLTGAAVGGNVLRIPAGGVAEVFVSSDCNGCHSVSADGSRMLSQIALATGGDSFQLISGGAPNPPGVAAGPRTSFGALYPDGSKYLSTSVVIEVARANLTQMLGGSADAELFDTTTGMVVPNTGIPTGALMPMFSPDGTRLVFNDNALDSAHGLALMNYDTMTDAATNYKMLTHETDPLRPAWPFFLPDAKAVIYVRTDSADFSGQGAGINGMNIAAPNSDLTIVDIASGEAVTLAQAMGYATPADAVSGKTYLPYGDDELHHNYYPTVSAVAAGGYFWVFFDSVRHYGNLGLQRQLWGAAIDIRPDGSYKLDPSHPPFYLPGQEFGTGNHRAFAALDPCKKDGDTCTSGIDCCGGTCTFPEAQELVDPVGSCAPPKQNSCAKTDERCKHDSDCCPPAPGQPANSCIAGFCAFVALN